MITNYVRKRLKFGVDHLGFQDPHFGNTSLKAYAKAGITFSGASGPIANLVSTLKKSGVTDDYNWFKQNPDHPLGAIHALFEKKFSNTVGRGGQQSIRIIYIELKRAPYGLRYNALSAFVMGFCLRDILQKNYRWTNGQISHELDDEALAEIIEMVIKDDGSNKLGNKEKLICRLSKEEKAFIENAPLIFGYMSNEDATVENVLKQIQNCVEAVSEKVPLWVLPEFIRKGNDPNADDIEAIIDDICIAFTTSSRGKLDDRLNAVKDAGEKFLEKPNIVNDIANYIKTENFIGAFDVYVDKVKPSIAKSAKSIGDVSHDYCRVIRDRCQETSGWLWNKNDITREIEDVECEYQIIKLAKPLCGFIGFTPYNNVFEVLKTAVTETNRLPKCMIESSYPMLGGFLSAVRYGSPANEINLALQQNFDVIQKLFFDQTKAASLSILRTRLNSITIDDADLLGIFNSVNSGFDLDETTFMEALYMKIEEYTKRSIVFKIKNEWIRISGTQTPDEWAMDNRIPARFAFGNHYSSSDLLRAINQPEELSAAKLDEILEMLKDVKTAKVEDCQKAFLADVIPYKYKKFEIGLAPILEYLCKKCGNQPNKWHFPVDIEEFIKNQYKVSIAPQVKEKLRTCDAEALKKRLVQLASENPELGLLFLED